MRKLENKIPPPIVVALTGVLMAIVAHFTPAPRWEGAWHFVLAGGFAIAGFAVLALGFRALGAAKTTIDPVQINRASALVTSGIYRFSRNPMYLGFAGLLLGWALLLASFSALIGPIFFVAFTTRFQILPEEHAIGAKFGRDFEQFRGRVRRWI